MQYRKLPKGTEQISILGLGTSSIQASSEKEIEEIVSLTIEKGINYFDMASAEAKHFEAYGRAIRGRRKDVYFQIHFGTNYETGTYGWTTNLDTIKRSVEWQLEKLGTDYIDFEFIHCIDEASDLRAAEKSGVINYILTLKQQGVVRYVGLINKYYDLAVAGAHLAREHYYKLEKQADACIGCGHCNNRCPFHVDQVARMERIHGYFESKKSD